MVAYFRLQFCDDITFSMISAMSVTAANKYICFYSGEYADQCTVAGAVGIYKLCFNDLAVFNIVQFELLGVTEMLKDVSVFVS